MIRQWTRHGLVRWLAFMALALVIAAPTVSRTLQVWSPDAVAAVLVSDCPEHAAHAPHPGTPDHPGLPGGDACGYCTLMGHSPPLASGVALLVLPLSSALFSIAFLSASAPTPARLDQRSRGPPVV